MCTEWVDNGGALLVIGGPGLEIDRVPLGAVQVAHRRRGRHLHPSERGVSRRGDEGPIDGICLAHTQWHFRNATPTDSRRHGE